MMVDTACCIRPVSPPLILVGVWRSVSSHKDAMCEGIILMFANLSEECQMTYIIFTGTGTASCGNKPIVPAFHQPCC